MYFFYDQPTPGYETMEGGRDIINKAPSIVSMICDNWLGVFGSILAILGVVAAPITSGDTALRSARLIIADFIHLEQRTIRKRLYVCVPMFAAVIALLGGFVAASVLKKSAAPTAKFAGLLRGAGVVIAVALTAVSCLSTVPAGHTGVVTTFGHVENYTLDAGVHMVKPWQQVVKMDNRVQKQTVKLACFSSDIQEVNMAYTINYQIRKADAMTLYSTVGVAYYDTVVSPNIAEAVKVATARYTAEELVGMRDELANAIELILSEKLEQYNIEVVSTSIEDMDFTDAFTDAVEAKQVAQQNKLKAQTEAEQRVIEANAAAEVKKVQADAEAYEVLARADAEAEANRKISESLTRDLIDYNYAQSWDGKLPMMMSGSDGAVIVNAGDLINGD
jgi:regulator of protease activity HflC (stomatin/prohibitin superfamily)